MSVVIFSTCSLSAVLHAHDDSSSFDSRKYHPHIHVCRKAKLLSTSADIGPFAKKYKSGAELWRLLVSEHEKKSACTVVSVVEMIKNVERAKSMTDNTRRLRQYESDDPDIRGATSGLTHVVTAGYLDVVKKSDLLGILPDSVIKDSRRSRDVKLETSFHEPRPTFGDPVQRTQGFRNPHVLVHLYLDLDLHLDLGSQD